MNLEQSCLESLAAHVRAEITDCGAPTAGHIQVPGMGMEFHA